MRTSLSDRLVPNVVRAHRGGFEEPHPLLQSKDCEWVPENLDCALRNARRNASLNRLGGPGGGSTPPGFCNLLEKSRSPKAFANEKKDHGY